MYLTFILIAVEGEKQVPTLILSQFIYRAEKVHMLLYYPEFLELGTGTCKASASSMLREGDWSHVQDTTSPGFRPTPRAGEINPRLSRLSSC